MRVIWIIGRQMKIFALLVSGLLALSPTAPMAADRHPGLPGAPVGQTVIASPYENVVLPVEREAPDPLWGSPPAPAPHPALPVATAAGADAVDQTGAVP